MTSKMSKGITPYEFVQQVYYMQEKTLLEFYPSDDKYREVLVEANLILRELEAVEDWTWLREQLVLGSCNGIVTEIVQFEIPDDVYKLSTLNHDCLWLYPVIGMEEETTYSGDSDSDVGSAVVSAPKYILDERWPIPVPIASSGDHRFNREKQSNWLAVNHIHDFKLRAVVQGNIIKFNRPLTPWESTMVLVADVQKHIKPFHTCTMNCWSNGYNSVVIGGTRRAKTTCDLAEEVYLTEIPDINYVIMATAARHAEGSPPALARVAGLQDTAQRILSQMRQNDASATDSDYIEWDVPGYVEVI